MSGVPVGMVPGSGRIVLAGTITKLPPDARDAMVVCGSHGGRYPGYLAACAGVRAVILNDAGIGRDAAGIGALAYLGALGIPAASVAARSCLIGDADDMMARGVISRTNAQAGAAGVRLGMACLDAAGLLACVTPRAGPAPPVGEGRSDVPGARPRRIVLLDSASLVRPSDAGQVVVTGSHGGLIGGDPAMALRVDAVVAAFNDAGRADGPGTSRLPVLDLRGIAAITVSSASARIGDAGSSYADGVISAANAAAFACGAVVGAPARDWLLACAGR